MAEGRLLFLAPTNRFVADLVGYANVLRGTVVAPGDGTATVIGTGSSTPLSRWGAGRAGAAVGVIIRPKWSKIATRDVGGEAGGDREAGGAS